MESFHLKQAFGTSIFIFRLRISQHKSLTFYFVDCVQLFEQIIISFTNSMCMALEIRTIDFSDNFFHFLEPILKGHVESRSIKDQVSYFLPLLVNRHIFPHSWKCFWELASPNEELTIHLTFGPALGEELGKVEAVAISGIHGSTSPKASDTIKFFAHDPPLRIYLVIPCFGQKHRYTSWGRFSQFRGYIAVIIIVIITCITSITLRWGVIPWSVRNCIIC